MTQHILVTGAASGIGRAAALALAGDRRAAEGALSDSLRLELKAFGIDVVGAAIVKSPSVAIGMTLFARAQKSGKICCPTAIGSPPC